MGNIKIFICAHKEVPLPHHPYFLPVQAGATFHEPILGYQPDNKGDNISIKNWEMLCQIIKDRSPEYIPTFEKTMDHSNKTVGYNMFLTHWAHFDANSIWLFDNLFEVELRVPPINDAVQSRMYGYMSERIINVFCKFHHLGILCSADYDVG